MKQKTEWFVLKPYWQEGTNDLECVVALSVSLFLLTQQFLKSHDLLRESGGIAVNMAGKSDQIFDLHFVFKDGWREEECKEY